MHRRAVLGALGTASIASLAGCASVLGAENAPCSNAGCEIGMSREAFIPERYTVAVGDTVVWRNTSGADHTVTAYESGLPDGATFFASGGYESTDAAREGWIDERGGAISPRGTFEHTFETAGTYSYFCIPHERAQMVGEIVVEER
jgi:plastocyanin